MSVAKALTVRRDPPPFLAGAGGGYDGAAEDFWDLRDDSVAEAMQAVHPSGNPMSHSTHVGFS